MTRCPRCGIRLSAADPRCPTHGPLVADADAGPQPSAAAGSLQPTAAFEAFGYRTSGVLGRGGFGVVYAAERVSDGARVAIKLAPVALHGAIESLRREASAMRAIGAPHVPAIYASGAVADAEYLVMERIEAETLAERLIGLAGPAPLPTFGRLAHALLQPLEAIHRAGYVHRDLKPENIFVLEQAARLIDFGLARQISDDAPDLERSAGADDVGTAEYMSPEQCDGLIDADPRSDIYSLGVLFYELLSGAPPFWGRAGDVREAHRSRRPAPLTLKAACAPELDHVIRQCLAKDRRQRWTNIPALRHALMAALTAPVPSKAPPPSAAGALGTKSAPPQPTAAREKRAMGLVFFESKAGVGGVQPLVTAAGGQIVQTNGAQYVAAFGHDVGDNPARVALVAAHRLFAAKLAQRLLVDVATVSVQNRPDGSRRIFSAVLSKQDRFPNASDPNGVMFTAAAAEVLPDLGVRALEGKLDRFMLSFQHGPNELTTLGIQLSPLVGREELLDHMLQSARTAAGALRPTLFTITGANGYGRTHLASVAAHGLEQSPLRFEVIRLTAQPSVLGSAQVLPELLRRALELSSGPAPADPKSQLMAALGEAGEGAWVGAAHALGWMAADHPEVARLASAPGALRLAMARAAGEALRRRAARKPVALILDDAHLADEAALDALEYATLRDVPARMWACVLVRPGFASRRPGWGSRAAVAHKITLNELAPEHAIELARRLLLPAEYVPETVLRRLAERTQGVPRLLVELVRGLKRDGFVRRHERGTGYFLATDALDKLPDIPIVQWNAIREVEALPPQLAGHARLASILGANFSVTEIEALLSTLEREQLPDDMQLDASVGVQRLIDTGVLVRHRNGLLDFRHALLRDTIYQLVPEPQRLHLHRAALTAYRELELSEELRLPRIALHAARCGERDLAAQANLELARRSTRAQVYLEAEAAYGRALENLAPDDERIISAARGRGLMRSRLGRQDGALADLRLAREHARARGQLEREIELMLDEATVLDWMREASQAGALVSAVENMHVALTPLLRARLAMGLARSHHRRGEAFDTVRIGREAVQLAAALGDDGYETRIVAMLMVATDAANAGHLEQAEQGFEQVITEAESRGDLFHVAAALGNRAVVWHGRHELGHLFADLERMVQLARELGEASVEFVAVYNLAESEYLLGKLDSARAGAMRGVELATQLFGDTNREVSVCELLLARIALYAGDFSVAAAHAHDIRERAARGSQAGEPDAELEPGLSLLLEMVELGARCAGIEAWQELLARPRSFELQPMEEVELLERAALQAARAGAIEVGRAFYHQALELSARKPNLLSERVARTLGAQFAVAD